MDASSIEEPAAKRARLQSPPPYLASFVPLALRRPRLSQSTPLAPSNSSSPPGQRFSPTSDAFLSGNGEVEGRRWLSPGKEDAEDAEVRAERARQDAQSAVLQEMLLSRRQKKAERRLKRKRGEEDRSDRVCVDGGAGKGPQPEMASGEVDRNQQRREEVAETMRHGAQTDALAEPAASPHPSQRPSSRPLTRKPSAKGQFSTDNAPSKRFADAEPCEAEVASGQAPMARHTPRRTPLSGSASSSSFELRRPRSRASRHSASSSIASLADDLTRFQTPPAQSSSRLMTHSQSAPHSQAHLDSQSLQRARASPGRMQDGILEHAAGRARSAPADVSLDTYVIPSSTDVVRLRTKVESPPADRDALGSLSQAVDAARSPPVATAGDSDELGIVPETIASTLPTPPRPLVPSESENDELESEPAGEPPAAEGEQVVAPASPGASAGRCATAAGLVITKSRRLYPMNPQKPPVFLSRTLSLTSRLARAPLLRTSSVVPELSGASGAPSAASSQERHRRANALADRLMDRRQTIHPPADLTITVSAIRIKPSWLPSLGWKKGSEWLRLSVRMRLYARPRGSERFNKAGRTVVATNVRYAVFVPERRQGTTLLRPTQSPSDLFLKTRLDLPSIGEAFFELTLEPTHNEPEKPTPHYRTNQKRVFKESDPLKDRKRHLCISNSKHSSLVLDDAVTIRTAWQLVLPWNLSPRLSCAPRLRTVRLCVHKVACQHSRRMTSVDLNSSQPPSADAVPPGASEAKLWNTVIQHLRRRASDHGFGTSEKLTLVSLQLAVDELEQKLADLAVTESADERHQAGGLWEIEAKPIDESGTMHVLLRMLHKPCALGELRRKGFPTPLERIDEERRRLNLLSADGNERARCSLRPSTARRKAVKVPKRGVLVRTETKERYTPGEWVCESEDEDGEHFAWRELRSEKAQDLYADLCPRTVFIKNLWNRYARQHPALVQTSSTGTAVICSGFVRHCASQIAKAGARAQLVVLLRALANVGLLEKGTPQIVELVSMYDQAAASHQTDG